MHGSYTPIVLFEVSASNSTIFLSYQNNLGKNASLVADRPRHRSAVRRDGKCLGRILHLQQDSGETERREEIRRKH